MSVDLFATNLINQLLIYFSPVLDPMSAGTDAMLQSWDGMEAYAFPPFAIVQHVILKFRRNWNTTMMLIAPFWTQKVWFPDLLELLVEHPEATVACRLAVFVAAWGC